MKEAGAPARASGAGARESSRRPLNVLCIDYSFGFGGATKSMGMLLREMGHVRASIMTSQDRHIRETWYGGHRITSFRQRITFENKWRLQDWVDAHVRWVVLRRMVMKLYALVDMVATAWWLLFIAVLVKVRRIDVVHMIHGYVPPEVPPAAWLAGVPCLVNLRTFWDGPYPLVTERVQRNTWVVGDSKWVTASVPESWCPPERRRTIYEPVDVAIFDATAGERERVRRAYGLSDDDVAFGIFGRVVRWKGQRVFAEAAVLAMRQNPSIRAFIVGSGDAYMEEVKMVMRASGLEDRFVLTGYTAEVEPFYAAMDVIVHASIDPEPCGMVVLEGMAARRPVIAAAAGGPLELVSEGVDGMLVPPSDPELLAAAMVKLAADASLRRAMGERGYEKAREQFDISVIAAQFTKLYDEIAGQSESSGR